jgi:hypothetical protein
VSVLAVPWTVITKVTVPGMSLQDIGRQTGADAVIEGAVQVPPRTGAHVARPVQVRIRMFHAQTGTTLWSESFERDMADFFALQAQIAQELASKINVVLAQRERAAVSRSRRVSNDAMELYLIARSITISRRGRCSCSTSTIWRRSAM